MGGFALDSNIAPKNDKIIVSGHLLSPNEKFSISNSENLNINGVSDNKGYIFLLLDKKDISEGNNLCLESYQEKVCKKYKGNNVIVFPENRKPILRSGLGSIYPMISFITQAIAGDAIVKIASPTYTPLINVLLGRQDSDSNVEKKLDELREG
jgi:hypothetical protein